MLSFHLFVKFYPTKPFVSRYLCNHGYINFYLCIFLFLRIYVLKSLSILFSRQTSSQGKKLDLKKIRFLKEKNILIFFSLCNPRGQFSQFLRYKNGRPDFENPKTRSICCYLSGDIILKQTPNKYTNTFRHLFISR